LLATSALVPQHASIENRLIAPDPWEFKIDKESGFSVLESNGGQ
jgi:hypothetical protein